MKAFVFKTQQTTGFIAFDIHGKYLNNTALEQEMHEILTRRGYTEIHREDHNVVVKGKLVSPTSNSESKRGEIHDIMLVPGIFDGSPYWIHPVDGKDPGTGGYHIYRYEVIEEVTNDSEHQRTA